MRCVIVWFMIMLAASQASPQTIGVFADTLGTNPILEIPFPGNLVSVFVVAALDGLQPDGMTTSQF